MNEAVDLKSLIKQGLRCFREQDFNGAITAFEQALAVDEKRIDLHEAIATTYFQMKRYEDAIRHFTRMTQLDPRLAKPYTNLGAVYNRMGDYQKAVDALRRGIAKDKNCSEAYYNLGIAHRGQEQPSLAISAYREALRADPQMAEAHQNLANIYVEQQNYRQAISHFNTALQIRPDFDRARRGLEHAEQARVEAERAISPFGRLVNAPESSRASAVIKARDLSEVERFRDRESVREIASGMEAIARQLLEQLRTGLEPRILTLTRVVAQSRQNDLSLVGAHPEFRRAVEDCSQLHKMLRNRTRDLAKHEQALAPS